MIVFPAGELVRLRAACEAAYPNEACGLIVGRAEATGFRVSRLEPSRNLAENARHAFEIDPRLRLAQQRALRGSGEAIIGLYHSHPDGSARPSATDLENAWEPELVWVIAAVAAGRVEAVTAHLLDQAAGRFRQIGLETA
jgi:proteasome lid subunit RPN8/RPN11